MANHSHNIRHCLLAIIPLLAISCATQTPPQSYHAVDSNALVIKSIDRSTCQILRPGESDTIENVKVIAKLSSLPEHHSAVVILENYTEIQLGSEFRDRSAGWFMCLRSLGYEHIVFLQGKGVSDPEGLIALARYD